MLVLRQDASSRWLKRLQEQFMLQCLISMVQQGLQVRFFSLLRQSLKEETE